MVMLISKLVLDSDSEDDDYVDDQIDDLLQKNDSINNEELLFSDLEVFYELDNQFLHLYL